MIEDLGNKPSAYMRRLVEVFFGVGKMSRKCTLLLGVSQCLLWLLIGCSAKNEQLPALSVLLSITVDNRTETEFVFLRDADEAFSANRDTTGKEEIVLYPLMLSDLLLSHAPRTFGRYELIPIKPNSQSSFSFRLRDEFLIQLMLHLEKSGLVPPSKDTKQQVLDYIKRRACKAMFVEYHRDMMQQTADGSYRFSVDTRIQSAEPAIRDGGVYIKYTIE